jgi:hypothetical protein
MVKGQIGDGGISMLWIVGLVIVPPLTFLIYLGYRLLKRPISLERSCDVAAMTVVGAWYLPQILIILAIAIMAPVVFYLAPFATLAWFFHRQWFPSFLSTPNMLVFGVPGVVWFTGLLLLIGLYLLAMMLITFVRERKS